LREVFCVPASDRSVKESVSAILELAKELLALYGRIIWWVWRLASSVLTLERDALDSLS
jgi:hypothetical protein